MKRKALAMILAASMVAGSSLTAFAADPETETQDITGSGDVEYLDPNVFSITLPTAAALNLTIDPQGLTNVTDGNSASLEDLFANAGTVKASSKPTIVNQSSVPIKVDVTLSANSDDTDTTFAEALADIDDTTTDKKILLYAVPAANSVVESDASDYEASTTGIVIGKTAQSVSFVLDGADYVVKNDNGKYDYVKDPATDNKGHGTALEIGGKVAKKADWSAYTAETGAKEFTMSAKFKVTKEKATDTADTTAGAPYGMVALASGVKTVTVTPANREASVATTGTIDSATGTMTIDVDLGYGTGAATFSMLLTGSSADNITVDKTSVATVENGKLTMPNASWVGLAAGTKKYAKVTLTKQDGTRVKTVVTVTAS